MIVLDWNSHLAWKHSHRVPSHVSETREAVKVGVVDVDLRLHCAPLRAEWVWVERIGIARKQTHVLPTLDHSQQAVVRIEVAVLCKLKQRNKVFPMYFESSVNLESK